MFREEKRLPRRWLKAGTLAAVPAFCMSLVAAQATSHRGAYSADAVVGYVAARSLRASTGQNFWMSGAAAEAGATLWHGLGPVVNITGAATDHVGNNGVPLSWITVAAGPRLRLKQRGRFSPYGEALFGLAHGFNSTFPSTYGSSSSANSFVLQTGGGLDVSIGKRLIVRPVDVSYLRSQLPNGTNNVQNTLQLKFSVGLVFGRY